MIFHVGDKNIILSGSSDPPGGLKETVAGTLAAKFSDESAIPIKDLDSIIAVITDNYSAFAVNGDICWAVKLAFALSMRTKLGDIFPPWTEYLDPVVITVGHIDVTFVVYGNSERRFELALLTAVLAKSKKRRANIGVFSAVDDEHRERAAHDWLILNGNIYFMFAIHFWHVSHRVGSIPCKRETLCQWFCIRIGHEY